jgi:hypothetical protein
VQCGAMKTSLSLDDELSDALQQTVSLVGEDTATVLRMAIRAGLPLVASRFQAPRPEGYFEEAYRAVPKERKELEEAFSKASQRPER